MTFPYKKTRSSLRKDASHMEQEIEIEFKNLLNKSEYKHLKNTFSPYHKNHTIQTNFYFETSTFQLKSKGAAFRVRSKDSKNIATLKLPNPDGPGLLEVHIRITEEELESWKENNILLPKELKDYFVAFDINPHDLKFGGSLKTIRDEYSYKDMLLVLDHSFYHGKEDYELELEADNEQLGKQVFDQILEENAITIRNTPNKVARFYESL